LGLGVKKTLSLRAKDLKALGVRRVLNELKAIEPWGLGLK
jgi:hypothetical protein